MITQNTGQGRQNKPVNVVVLQQMLNDCLLAENLDEINMGGLPSYVLSRDAPGGNLRHLPPLRIDGISESDLSDRIKIYQTAKSMNVIDGWVAPNGATMRSLLVDARVGSSTNQRMDYLRAKLRAPFGTRTIKVDPVIRLYEKQYSALSPDRKEGLKYILSTAIGDSSVELIPELAYMLATTKHETAHTYMGISEFGQGRGRPYGREITVIDPTTQKVYKNTYYGRGYVQLTWGFNYQRLDHHLGHGIFPHRNQTREESYNRGFTISAPAKSLYLNPEMALEKENSYVGLVWGMQQGIYTGRTIGQYISSGNIDYFNARRVINGTDRAADIAAYAEDFEVILRVSTL